MQSHKLWGLKIKRSIDRYVTDTKVIIKVDSLRTEMKKLHMTVYGLTCVHTNGKVFTFPITAIKFSSA